MENYKFVEWQFLEHKKSYFIPTEIDTFSIFKWMLWSFSCVLPHYHSSSYNQYISYFYLIAGEDFISMDRLDLLLKATARLDVWLVIESCDMLLLNLTPCAAGLLYGNLQGEFGGGGSNSNPRLSVPASFMWLFVSSSFLDESRLQKYQNM